MRQGKIFNNLYSFKISTNHETTTNLTLASLKRINEVGDDGLLSPNGNRSNYKLNFIDLKGLVPLLK